MITIDDALLQLDNPVREATEPALWRTRPLAERAALEALCAQADRLRDEGQQAAAAACYAKAFELGPWRNDLRVQQGNMPKDLGNLEDAGVSVSRSLLGGRPEPHHNAGTALQPSRAFKMAAIAFIGEEISALEEIGFAVPEAWMAELHALSNDETLQVLFGE